MMSVINDKPSHDDSSKEKSIKMDLDQDKSNDSNTNLISSGVNTKQ